MRLVHLTWLEVETYLKTSGMILVPVGSTEQHGPMGLIGTDAICAEEIAFRVGSETKTIVAPTLALTPAPFNLAFPGSVSISETTFLAVVREMITGFVGQGFEQIYFLNGHGANLAPLRSLADNTDGADIRIRSWWDFDAVNRLRQAYYGEWEGMHATPSEISITQALHRRIDSNIAAEPPRQLSADYIKAHAGDRHGPAEAHRAAFPDGRVGSHSALARPEHGKELLDAASRAITADLLEWSAELNASI